MRVACILSTFGKHWVRRIISEPWSTLGRNQSAMFITEDGDFLKNLLKSDSQNLESPFNDPSHPRLPPLKRSWVDPQGPVYHGKDQGSFPAPSLTKYRPYA